MDKSKLDGASLHMLSEKGIYIEPMRIKEFRERMRQIKQDHDDEMAAIDRGEISTKYGFEVWNMIRKEQIKRVEKFTKLRKLLTILKKLKIK